MKFLKFILILLISQLYKQKQERKLLTNDFHDEQLQPKFKGADLRDIFQNSENNNSAIRCNHDLLTSYGMTGVSKSEIRTHQFCPAIKENCCTNEDAIRSKFLWNNQSKFMIERYYQTYYFAIKYLLGYSQEAYLLARKQENSDQIQCKNAAVDLISQNFNPGITQEVYETLVEGMNKMSNIRKGFYCIICDAESQKEFFDFWVASNQLSNDRLYFSQNFCKKLVDEQIKGSFFFVFYVKRYLDNLNILMNCQSKTDNYFQFEVDYQLKSDVKNCYYFQKQYFFFFCESYCERFRLTKANGIFDGNLIELEKFVQQVSQQRYTSFSYPNNNFFMDGVIYEEKYMTFNFKEILKDLVFFRPLQQQTMLEKFKTDIVYYGGVDPYESIQDNEYDLHLEFTDIVVICNFIILFLLYQLLLISSKFKKFCQQLMINLKFILFYFLINSLNTSNVIKIEELSYNKVPRKVFIDKILAPIKSKISTVKDFLLSPKVHGIVAGSVGIPLVWWHKFGKPSARKKIKAQKRQQRIQKREQEANSYYSFRFNLFFDKLRDLFSLNGKMRRSVDHINLIIEEMDNIFLQNQEKALESIGAISELTFTIINTQLKFFEINYQFP